MQNMLSLEVENVAEEREQLLTQASQPSSCSKRRWLVLLVTLVVIGIVCVVLSEDVSPSADQHNPTLKMRILRVLSDQGSQELGNDFEGDIKAGRTQLEGAYGPNVQTTGLSLAQDLVPKDVYGDGATAHGTYLWPGGYLYYTINSDLPSKSRSDLDWAVNHIECHVPGIFIRRRSSEAYWVDVRNGGGCSSYIGKRWGGQPIRLNQGCGRGAAVHELLHALGFWHEQSRPDRDSFVNIYLNNVLSGYTHNFNKRGTNDINSRGYPYDFGSIMHYGSKAFGKVVNGARQTTISQKFGGATIGQRGGLSGNDVMQLRALYQPPTGKVYFIKSVHSGKVMDVEGWSRSRGGDVHQWSLHRGRNQMWIVPVLNQYTWVKSVHSGAYLDISGGSTSHGANLHQWTYHGGNNQQFKFELLGSGQYRIRVRHSGKYLDVSGVSKSNGATIHQWGWHGGNNQRWTLMQVSVPTNIYFIVSENGGKAMDATGGGRGNNVHQWQFHGDLQQQFQIFSLGGWTTVKNLRQGNYLDISGVSHSNGASLHMWTYHGGYNQQFKFESLGGNSYRIRVRHSGKYLDVHSASKNNGANIIQWPWHGGANQRWKVFRVPAF